MMMISACLEAETLDNQPPVPTNVMPSQDLSGDVARNTQKYLSDAKSSSLSFASSGHRRVYPIPELAFDLAMPTSSFLKILALLALLTIDVSAASLKPVRRLRGEQTQDEARSQSSRVLQNKFGWLGIVKTNVVRQPVSDKLYEKYKQIRDKVQGKDMW
ncbi:hypothetical protein PRIC2_004624 [Phytophthora ramorum]